MALNTQQGQLLLQSMQITIENADRMLTTLKLNCQIELNKAKNNKAKRKTEIEKLRKNIIAYSLMLELNNEWRQFLQEMSSNEKLKQWYFQFFLSMRNKKQSDYQQIAWSLMYLRHDFDMHKLGYQIQRGINISLNVIFASGGLALFLYLCYLAGYLIGMYYSIIIPILIGLSAGPLLIGSIYAFTQKEYGIGSLLLLGALVMAFDLDTLMIVFVVIPAIVISLFTISPLLTLNYAWQKFINNQLAQIKDIEPSIKTKLPVSDEFFYADENGNGVKSKDPFFCKTQKKSLTHHFFKQHYRKTSEDKIPSESPTPI